MKSLECRYNLWNLAWKPREKPLKKIKQKISSFESFENFTNDFQALIIRCVWWLREQFRVFCFLCIYILFILNDFNAVYKMKLLWSWCFFDLLNFVQMWKDFCLYVFVCVFDNPFLCIILFICLLVLFYYVYSFLLAIYYIVELMPSFLFEIISNILQYFCFGFIFKLEMLLQNFFQVSYALVLFILSFSCFF